MTARSCLDFLGVISGFAFSLSLGRGLSCVRSTQVGALSWDWGKGLQKAGVCPLQEQDSHLGFPL